MELLKQQPKGETLMPLKVTDQAAAALQQLLEDQDPKPAQVLRLVSNTEGNFLLALDTKKDGDQVVKHKGRMVMVIGLSVSEGLSGHTLDWKQTRSGRSFTFGSANTSLSSLLRGTACRAPTHVINRCRSKYCS